LSIVGLYNVDDYQLIPMHVVNVKIQKRRANYGPIIKYEYK